MCVAWPRVLPPSLQRYDCRYGTMLTLPSDNVIGKSLRIYGEWAEHELSILRSFISPGATVVDVGANIGTHTLPFSRWVENGRVMAIEGSARYLRDSEAQLPAEWLLQCTRC